MMPMYCAAPAVQLLLLLLPLFLLASAKKDN